ncbi:hypothetical protein QAD02_013724 [Eretmocerus hayati]|uniref:Uncharacterized protein n=1 Tax=Eretmocerus hayati TaxID=131215 RepID=A0ACC2P662_9HYME|nr:hypothetical protein QAD02_013724 [Eretmocerus hayati]
MDENSEDDCLDSDDRKGELKREELAELRAAQRMERMHPYGRNNDASTSNLAQEVLRKSGEKLKIAVKSELNKSEAEVGKFIDDQSRSGIRDSFKKINLHIDGRGEDTMNGISEMEDGHNRATGDIKTNVAKAAQRMMYRVAEAAAARSLELICKGMDELDKGAK